MVGGRLLLADQLLIIMPRIQRLATNDPMRAVEEEALVALVMRERCRSGMPLGDGAYATLVAPGGPLAHAPPPRDPRRCPGPSSSAPPPRPTSSPQPGPSGARGGPPRPPPGFVDLTTEEDEDMGEAPATPPPNISDDSDQQMDTDEEENLLSYGIGRDSSSDEDGFQHA